MMRQRIKGMSSYRLSLKDRILDAALTLFAERGVRAVKMDDIAKSLQISKRTLYEIYKDKEDLLFEGIRKYDLIRKEQFRQYAEQAPNVMDIIVEVYRQKAEESKRISATFYNDIQKYPRITEYLRQEREQSHERFMAFLRRGVEEGFFRSDVNYDILFHFFESIGKHVMENQMYSQYTFEEIFANLPLVGLRGVCTERGVKILDEAIH